MIEELTQLAVGDIQLALEQYPEVLGVTRPKHTPISDAHSWLAQVAAVLQEADFAFGNLEGEIGELHSDDPDRSFWGRALRMPPKATDAIKWAGLTAVSVCGNYTMDLGRRVFWRPWPTSTVWAWHTPDPVATVYVNGNETPNSGNYTDRFK